MATGLTDRTGFTLLDALKAPCRVASTANIDLATGGLLTIDGVVLAEGDRVLAKDQTDASENGIYTVQTGAWTRTADFDGDRDVITGVAVLITEGSTSPLTIYTLSTTGTIVVGTTNLTFTPVITANSLTYVSWAGTAAGGEASLATPGRAVTDPDGYRFTLDGVVQEPTADYTVDGALEQLNIVGTIPAGARWVIVQIGV